MEKSRTKLPSEVEMQSKLPKVRIGEEIEDLQLQELLTREWRFKRRVVTEHTLYDLKQFVEENRYKLNFADIEIKAEIQSGTILQVTQLIPIPIQRLIRLVLALADYGYSPKVIKTELYILDYEFLLKTNNENDDY